MSVALVKIDKSYGSEVWSNTWAVGITGVGATEMITTPQLSSDDLTYYLPSANLSDDGTNPSETAYEGATSVLAAIVGFERQCTSYLVKFDKLIISDGLYNTSAFRTFTLGFNGLSANVNSVDNLAEGSVCAMISRIPAAIGAHNGRLYLRGSLAKSDVTFNGFRLVGLSNAGQTTYTTTIRAYFSNTTGNSKLASYTRGANSELDTRICIPVYEKVVIDGKQVQQLKQCNVIQTIGEISAVSRQVKKGRKRTISA